MTTRCIICKFYKEENKFKSIYCHNDGYPEHVGKILINHYNTNEKIDELLNGGYIQYLNETIEKTIFFIRDLKEKIEYHQKFDFTADNLEEAYNIIMDYYPSSSNIESIYVFINDEWIYKATSSYFNVILRTILNI